MLLISPAVKILLLLLFLPAAFNVNADLQTIEGTDVIILVPRGEDPNTAKNRVVIPQGSFKPFLLSESVFIVCSKERSSMATTSLSCIWTRRFRTWQNFYQRQFSLQLHKWHGRSDWWDKAWIVKLFAKIPKACVADDMSVIQIGRTFLKNGMRHRCELHGSTVTYEQSG